MAGELLDAANMLLRVRAILMGHGMMEEEGVAADLFDSVMAVGDGWGAHVRNADAVRPDWTGFKGEDEIRSQIKVRLRGGE